MKRISEKTISGIMSKLKPDEITEVTGFAERLHQRECKEQKCYWLKETSDFKEEKWILGPEHRRWFWKAWDFWQVNRSKGARETMLYLLDICAGRV